MQDNAVVEKFCNDMETTPVGVVVGLFQAISQKLPAFGEWDSRKHQQLLGNNPNVSAAMDEVREHVNKFGSLTFPSMFPVSLLTSHRSLSAATQPGEIRSQQFRLLGQRLCLQARHSRQLDPAELLQPVTTTYIYCSSSIV